MSKQMILNFGVHLVLLLLFAPLLPGIITRTKSRMSGRRGAPLLQLYFDILRLFRKTAVFSRTTTIVFLIGPAAALVIPILASLLIPFGNLHAPISFQGDMILFIYLFGVLRFFTAAAALDTGSAFEGMGAAREVTFSCLAEPALIFCLLSLAGLSDSTSLNTMFSGLTHAWDPSAASLGLVVIALCVVLLVENCRIPFDDPNTHLELTMIHEVMVLDHSGPPLGMILYGAALKLWVLGALVVGLVLPIRTGNILLDAPIFLAAMMLLAVGIGLVESLTARFKLLRIPQILIGTTLISFFSLVLVLR